MAYISAEDVKAIRNELKAKFPKYKFAVRKSSGSLGVDVTLVKGPRNLSDITENGHTQVNQYWLDRTGKHAIFFKHILEIMKEAPSRGEGYHKGRVWYDKSDAMTDYFDTAYYMHLEVGTWSTPYVQV